VNVSGVSEPLAYLPVGIVHRRPTCEAVKAVQRRVAGRAAGPQDEVPGLQGEVSGPKLLVDLSLIAPRPIEPGKPKADGRGSVADVSEASGSPAGRPGVSARVDLVA